MTTGEEVQMGDGQGEKTPNTESTATRPEVNANEIKVLLDSPTIGNQYFYFGSSGVAQEKLDSPTIGNQHFHLGPSGAAQEKPLDDLPDDLPSLPKGLHPFQDPRHDRMLSELEERRIILLASYQESAAYAAAFSLVHDDHFHRQAKRSLYPTRNCDKERSDLDLVSLTEESILGKTPQILLIDIGSWCTLFDSVLRLDWGIVSQVHARLEEHSSYLILALNEDLLNDEKATARAKSSFPYYAVSHLRYLLSRDLADRAEDLEKRLLAAIGNGASPTDLQELHQHVANRLAEGMAAFEEFLIQ